jgi:acyl-CoA thioester hydrolase
MAGEFTMKRRVQFSEIDRAGVLYFGNYYRFMEEAEHAFWRSMGVSVVTEIDGREISWPRVRTSCEYYAPARFEDELELALRVTKVGSRSVGFEVEFTCEGRRIALGRMTVVFCTIGAGKFRPVSIPESLRGILENRLSLTDQTG